MQMIYVVGLMTSSRIRGAFSSCLFLTSILSSFQDFVCSRVLKGVGSLSGIASFPGAQPGGVGVGEVIFSWVYESEFQPLNVVLVEMFLWCE